jgi:prepilin-type N-terminal cleavage/methylation domain-containing protein
MNLTSSISQRALPFSPSDGRTRRAARGFTLLEMVLALIIIAMLSTAVYGILSTSVSTATQVQNDQIEADQVNQFIRLCRQAFQNLPSTATITLTTTQPGTPAIQEFTISGAPECFSFGTNPISYKDTIISTRPNQDATNATPDGSPIYDISITREDIIPSDGNSSPVTVQASLSGALAADDQGRTWLPLLPNVDSLTWRLYQDDDTQWVDEWSNTNLPQLVEMTLQMHGRTTPMRVVFTIPGTKIAGANANLKPTATATTDDGGGGGGAGGGRGKGGKGKDSGKGGKGKDGGKGGKGGNKSGTNSMNGKEGKSSNKSSKGSSSDKGSSGKSSGGSSSSKGGGGGGGGSSSGGGGGGSSAGGGGGGGRR